MRDFVPEEDAQHETDLGGFRDFSPHPTPEEMEAMKKGEPLTDKKQEELEANTPPTEEEKEEQETAGDTVCDVCGFKAKTLGGLKAHIRFKHEDES